MLPHERHYGLWRWSIKQHYRGFTVHNKPTKAEFSLTLESLGCICLYVSLYCYLFFFYIINQDFFVALTFSEVK